MRFPAQRNDLFARRQQELLLLDCDTLLSDEPGRHATARADIQAVLLRMLAPPVLRTGKPDNELLALERVFENQVAELETHCNVSDAAGLSVYRFMSRMEYFEAMMQARRGSKE